MSIVKNSIAALVLSSAVVAPVMAETSSWATVSLNSMVREDSSSEFLELEGNITMGSVNVYGFVDIADNSTFTKINPTFHVTESVFINTQIKYYSEEGYDSTDNHVGIGYTFKPGTGTYNVSFNVRNSGVNQGLGLVEDGMNGYTAMLNMHQPLTESLSVGGWVDHNMEAENGAEDFTQGNIGLRYDMNEVMYTRVAYDFNTSEGSSEAVQLTVGIKF